MSLSPTLSLCWSPGSSLQATPGSGPTTSLQVAQGRTPQWAGESPSPGLPPDWTSLGSRAISEPITAARGTDRPGGSGPGAILYAPDRGGRVASSPVKPETKTSQVALQLRPVHTHAGSRPSSGCAFATALSPPRGCPLQAGQQPRSARSQLCPRYRCSGR